MHRNVLRHTGPIMVLLFLSWGHSQERVFKTFKMFSWINGSKHQEKHVRSAASSLTVDCFLETEMTRTLFWVFNNTIWCFKLHWMPLESLAHRSVEGNGPLSLPLKYTHAHLTCILLLVGLKAKQHMSPRQLSDLSFTKSILKRRTWSGKTKRRAEEHITFIG